jgi:hypothetical protein
MATMAIMALALAGATPVGPAPTQAALLADLRAPDQRALLAQAGDGIRDDLRAPDQQAPAPGRTVSDGRRTASVLGLIGLSGVLVLLAGAGMGFRRRAAAADHPSAR